jgi:hypothetical protein
VCGGIGAAGETHGKGKVPKAESSPDSLLDCRINSSVIVTAVSGELSNCLNMKKISCNYGRLEDFQSSLFF